MSRFEVELSVVEKAALCGFDNIDDLCRHIVDLSGQQLPPEGFPLAAGQEFVEAYQNWLQAHTETIRDEAAGWGKTFSSLNESANLYSSVDQSTADDMREFSS